LSSSRKEEWGTYLLRPTYPLPVSAWGQAETPHPKARNWWIRFARSPWFKEQSDESTKRFGGGFWKQYLTCQFMTKNVILVSYLEQHNPNHSAIKE
jgi:hypothetical protein